MYEYKVLILKVKECEETFNKFAKEGWRLVAMVPNNAIGYGVVATLERETSKLPNQAARAFLFLSIYFPPPSDSSSPWRASA